jgi:hypothetical protein
MESKDTPSHTESELLSIEAEDLLEKTQAAKVDTSQFSQDMLLEPSQEYTPARRDSLAEMIAKMSLPQKIRLALVGNQEVRALLIHDPNKVIPLAILRNSKVTENEILTFAQLKNLPEEAILAISRNKNWIKNYLIKLALVTNPKTPLSMAIKFLDHLHDKDLRALRKNKNISSILAQSAARLLIKRTG